MSIISVHDTGVWKCNNDTPGGCAPCNLPKIVYDSLSRVIGLSRDVSMYSSYCDAISSQLNLFTGACRSGGYKIVNIITAGLSGVVFAGVNLQNKPIVIKLYRLDEGRLYDEIQLKDNDGTRRWSSLKDREFRYGVKIHQSISKALAGNVRTPRILDAMILHMSAGKDIGLIVMERIVGETVASILKFGSVNNDELAFRIGEALRTMHKAGFVHGDFHTNNIFLVETEGGSGWDVTLLDFDRATEITKSGGMQWEQFDIFSFLSHCPETHWDGFFMGYNDRQYNTKWAKEQVAVYGSAANFKRHLWGMYQVPLDTSILSTKF